MVVVSLGEMWGLQKALRCFTCLKIWGMPITFWCWHQWCHDSTNMTRRVDWPNHWEEGRVCLERSLVGADKNAQTPSTCEWWQEHWQLRVTLQFQWTDCCVSKVTVVSVNFLPKFNSKWTNTNLIFHLVTHFAKVKYTDKVVCQTPPPRQCQQGPPLST